MFNGEFVSESSDKRANKKSVSTRKYELFRFARMASRILTSLEEFQERDGG